MNRSRVSCFDARLGPPPFTNAIVTLIYLGILYGIAVLESRQFAVG